MDAFGHRARRARLPPRVRLATVAAVLRRTWPCLWLGVLACLAIPSRPARACSCLPPPPPKVALSQSDAVFEGRPFATNVVGSMAEFSFEVDRVWKGELPARVTIKTATSSAACGRTYQIGQSYVVYARRGTGTALLDGLCSRTRTSAAAGEDLEELGIGEEVHSVRPRPRDDDDDELDREVPREPPRIEPPPPAIGPTAPGKRGCSVEMAHTPGGTVAGLGLWLVIAIARRRRVRLRHRDPPVR